MRIAIMGQAAFGAEALETLSKREENIIGAWLPQGKAGGMLPCCGVKTFLSRNGNGSVQKMVSTIDDRPHYVGVYFFEKYLTLLIFLKSES
jgi:hypothetical protein